MAGDTMQPTAKRESGYYWVIYDGINRICSYDSEDDTWLFCGSTWEVKDNNFDHIGQRVPTEAEYTALIAPKEPEQPKEAELVPFDWEVYKQGGWVAVTREGMVAQGLRPNKDKESVYPLVAFVDGFGELTYQFSGRYSLYEDICDITHMKKQQSK